jgi:hypothetical protein
MIMFDRETESWWQQATGEGIAGELTGAEFDASQLGWKVGASSRLVTPWPVMDN